MTQLIVQQGGFGTPLPGVPQLILDPGWELILELFSNVFAGDQDAKAKTVRLDDVLVADDLSERQLVAVRAFIDAVNLVEASSGHSIKRRVDGLLLVDDISLTSGNFIVTGETLPFTDNIIIVDNKREFQSPLAITDYVNKESVRVTVSLLTLTDIFIAQPEAVRHFLSELGLSESVIMDVTRHITEGLSLSDALAKTLETSIVDTLTVIDAIKNEIISHISDGLSLEDALARTLSHITNDPLDLADILAKDITALMETGLSLNDSIVLITTGLVQIINHVELSDNTFKELHKMFEEGLDISDIVRFAVERIVSDNISIDDSFNMEISKSVRDTLVVSDTFVRFVTRFIYIQSTIALLDNMKVVLPIVTSTTNRIIYHTDYDAIIKEWAAKNDVTTEHSETRAVRPVRSEKDTDIQQNTETKHRRVD